MVNYESIAVIFGVTIAGLNIWNWQKSPIVTNRTDPTDIKVSYITIASIFKGCVYGAVWPLPVLDITLNWFTGDKYGLLDRHFIPFSIYRPPTPREIKT